ncbi:MAG: hypothetical protein V7700_15920 [Halioglobus sp.]
MLNELLSWLSENEGSISAVVGLTFLVGLALGPIRSVVRRRDNNTPKEGRADTDEVLAPTQCQTPANSRDTLLALLPVTHARDDISDDAWARSLDEDLATYLSRSTVVRIVAGGGGNFESLEDILKSLRKRRVRYTLQTRIRPKGDQIRVNTQLIDVATAQYLWSHFYTRELETFETEAEDLAHMIATQVLVPIIQAEVSHALAMDESEWDYRMLTHVGYHAFMFGGRDEDVFRETRKLMNRAVELGPEDPHARATRAISLATTVAFNFSEDPATDVATAKADIELAMRRAPSDATVLHARAWVSGYFEGYKYGVPFLERAIESDPSHPHIRADYAYMLFFSGQTEEGKAQLAQAFRLSEHDPREYIWRFFSGAMSLYEGDPEAAIEHLDISIALATYPVANMTKIIALLVLSREQEARQALEEFAYKCGPTYGQKEFLSYTSGVSKDEALTRKIRKLAEVWPGDTAN